MGEDSIYTSISPLLTPAAKIPIESAIAEGPGPDRKLDRWWQTRQNPLKNEKIM